MTTTPVMSITDEQIAEIEAQCLQCDQKGGAVIMSSDSLSSLIYRLRAAEKDAERYRWLRDGCDEKSSLATYIAANCCGIVWDAAIDSAMEQSK